MRRCVKRLDQQCTSLVGSCDVSSVVSELAHVRSGLEENDRGALHFSTGMWFWGTAPLWNICQHGSGPFLANRSVAISSNLSGPSARSKKFARRLDAALTPWSCGLESQTARTGPRDTVFLDITPEAQHRSTASLALHPSPSRRTHTKAHENQPALGRTPRQPPLRCHDPRAHSLKPNPTFPPREHIRVAYVCANTTEAHTMVTQ